MNLDSRVEFNPFFPRNIFIACTHTLQERMPAQAKYVDTTSTKAFLLNIFDEESQWRSQLL